MSKGKASAEAINWISVDDYLPDSGKRVLFAWMNGYTPPQRRIGAWFYAAKHDIELVSWGGGDCIDYSEEKDQAFCIEGWHESMWEADYFYPVTSATHWAVQPMHPELCDDIN